MLYKTQGTILPDQLPPLKANYNREILLYLTANCISIFQSAYFNL
jgi:hypothetical protein